MLRLKEISKVYNNNQGVKDVNINIEKGNLYLFVGENGAGKSTVIKLIVGAIFANKNSGVIENSFKKMVYLPDKREYPPLINTETFLLCYLGNEKKEVIKEYIKKYNLPNKPINSLSKGMYQKLGIIQVIADNADLYLFDEPLDGLDKESIGYFKEDISNLLNSNKTIVISTHNKNVFKSLNPIIYEFKNGKCNEKIKRIKKID